MREIITTKYYKKIWEVFQNPILTSNTDYGVLTNINLGSEPYKLFDGQTNDYNSLGYNATNDYFQIIWDLPKPICISEFKVWSRVYGQYCAVTNVRFYAEVNDSWVLLGELLSQWTIAKEGTAVKCNDKISFTKLKIALTGNVYAGGGIYYWAWCCELAFSGKSLLRIEEITKEEYEDNFNNGDYFKKVKNNIKDYFIKTSNNKIYLPKSKINNKDKEYIIKACNN